jgi:hypothetical protein
MFTIMTPESDGSPWPLLDRLLNECEELEELASMIQSGTTLAFMTRGGDWTSNGRRILGMCHCAPSAQGQLRPLFEQLLEDTVGYYPDFLIILAADYWDDADDERRLPLLFHELLHIKHARTREGDLRWDRESGKAIGCMRPHDIEEFKAVVERFGNWSPDVGEFVDAARRGGL